MSSRSDEQIELLHQRWTLGGQGAQRTPKP